MKYIGERKIKSHKETKETTPGGVPIIEVKYEDGTEIFTELMFNAVVSDKPYDPTDDKAISLKNKRAYGVVEALLTVLREWNIKPEEVNHIVDVLIENVQRNSNQALTNIIREKFPEVHSFNHLSFLDIDKLLKDAK